MTEYHFGSGIVYGFRTDVAPSTPVKLGVLQDVSVDFSYTVKELMGQNQFPADVARGSGKITGKAKFAKIDGQTLNSLFFGETLNTGQILAANNEAASIPGVSTYTVTAANAATFVNDQGPLRASDLSAFTKVSSLTAIGQYTVNEATGIYTFFSGDASAAIYLNYTYLVTTGKQLTINNNLMGTAPYFRIVLFEKYLAKGMTITLNRCIASKLAIATKTEDYVIPELDFQAMDDGSGVVGKIGLSE